MGKKTRIKKLRLEKQQEIQKSSTRNDRVISFSILSIIFLIIFSVIFTLMRDGVPSGHDIAAHASRSKMMYEALSQGQFPARWVEWTYSGASEPLFNFYQPGLYYIVSLLHLIIPSLTTSLKVAVLLIWWTGALFMFLFMRRYGTLPAALSCLLYTFAPYILINVFVRAAYPELMAISFFLGVFFATDRIMRTANPLYAIPLSLCLALVFVSHLPTVVILGPVLACYCLLLFIQKEVRIKGFLLACLSFLIGIGIAGFYLFPALIELPLINNKLLTYDTYDFHQHFVEFFQFFSFFWGYGISLAGPKDGMSFQFGIIQDCIFIITLLVLGVSVIKREQLKIQNAFILWLCAIPYAVFFMLTVSLPFWENFRIISFIQYPWRYLMVIAVSSSILGGILISLIKNIRYQTVCIVVIIISIFVSYWGYLKPNVYLPYNFFNIDSANWKESEGVKKYTFLEQGYLPIGVGTVPKRENAPISRWQLIGGKGIVTEKEIKYHDLSFATESNESLGLAINVHNFPGWKAYLDTKPLPINSNNPYDYMTFSIPSGIHVVEIKFTNTPIRSISNIVSVLSIILLIGFEVWSFRKTQKLPSSLTSTNHYPIL